MHALAERRRDLPSVRDHFETARGERARHVLRVCLAAAAFVECDGPRCFAHSQVDYARGVLGTRPGQFKRWLRMGRLLERSDALAGHFATARLSFSAWDELALASAPVDAIEQLLPFCETLDVRQIRSLLHEREQPTVDSSATAEDRPEPDPTNLERFELDLPAPASAYVDDTLKVARALIGAELPDDACIEAVVAEASTEIDPIAPASVARQLHESLWTSTRHSSAERSQLPAKSRRPNHDEAEPRRRARMSDDARWRRRCHTLHRLLARRVANLRHHEARRDDHLLDLLHRGEHVKWGFARFQDFAREAFDLPASTTWDRIARARRLRSDDPIGRALLEGRIGAEQAALLARLQRRRGVPPSAIPRWIDFAQHRTTLTLREACIWAAHRSTTDYVRWSVEGHPPPTDAQLRMSNRPLEEILDSTADLEAWPAHTSAMPQLRRHWLMDADVLDLLLQQIHHLDAQRPWLALVRICALARQSWSQHVEIRRLPGLRRRVLERDRWRCQAPECTRRRNLQVHHVHYASRGGPDDESNLVVLCAFHHLLGEHGGLLRVRGAADAEGNGFKWEMGFDANGRPAQVYADGRKLS